MRIHVTENSKVFGKVGHIINIFTSTYSKIPRRFGIGGLITPAKTTPLQHREDRHPNARGYDDPAMPQSSPSPPSSARVCE